MSTTTTTTTTATATATATTTRNSCKLVQPVRVLKRGKGIQPVQLLLLIQLLGPLKPANLLQLSMLKLLLVLAPLIVPRYHEYE